MTASVSTGLLSPPTVSLIHSAYFLQQKYRHSVLLSSNWLQLMLAAVLAMQFGPMSAREVDRLNFVPTSKGTALVALALSDKSERELLVERLGTYLEDIVLLLKVHLAVPTVVHLSLLITRLVLRKPFMSKKLIDLFVEDNTLVEKDAVEEEGQLEEVINHDSNGFNTYAEMELFLLDVMTRKDMTESRAHCFYSAGAGGEYISLFSLLLKCAEMHLQCVDLIEQFLLLLRHFCIVSNLAKMVLHDCLMCEWVDRLRHIYSRNPYICALCEIAAEEIMKKD